MKEIVHLSLIYLCTSLLPFTLSEFKCKDGNNNFCTTCEPLAEGNLYLECEDIPVKVNVDEINITCSSHKNHDYITVLKNLNMTSHFERLTFSQCSPPSTSFGELLKIPMLRSIVNITFKQGSMNTLNSSSFKNLENITSLKLTANGITKLHEEPFRNMLHLKALDLSENLIGFLPSTVFVGLYELQYLNLEYNKNLSYLDPTIFHDLNNLKQLHLNDMGLRNVTKGVFDRLSKLTHLYLGNNVIEHLDEGVFDNLRNLQELELRINQLKHIPENIFANNFNMEILLIDNTFKNTVSLPEELFKHFYNLKEVNLRDNSFEILPKDIFKYMKNLERLRIGNNHLVSLNNDQFSTLGNLKKLELENNKIRGIESNVFRGLTSLQILDLSNNKMKYIEENAFADIRKTVEEINLSGNSLSENTTKLFNSLLSANCTANDNSKSCGSNFTTLKKLNLSHNKFQKLEPMNFDIALNNATIDISYNEIISVPTLDDLKNYFNNVCNPANKNCINRFPNTFKVDGNPIECNCNIFELTGVIKKEKNLIDNLMKMEKPNTICSSPHQMKNHNMKDIKETNLICLLDEEHRRDFGNCTKGCKCYYLPADPNSVIVNCSASNITSITDLNITRANYCRNNHSVELSLNDNKLKTLKGLSTIFDICRIRKLTLSSNELENIDDLRIAKELKDLRLDNNYLTNLNQHTINLFENLTHISLHNNPWECDCSMISLIKFIKNEYNKDAKSRLIEEIHCKDNRLVNNLIEEDVCHQQMMLYIILGFIMLTFLTSACYFKNKIVIKIWLYQFDIFRCIISEEEVNKYKEFDAFVSFNGEDEEFVEKHLIPQLEHNGEYKLCTHRRDFVVGPLINKQISEKIENSRRTIIILSPNFLASNWTTEEFKIAHLLSLKQRNTQVIIIMLKDIDEEVVEPDLQAYITTRSYLKWNEDDPLFWDKLRKKLPPRQTNRKQKSKRDYEMLEKLR